MWNQWIDVIAEMCCNRLYFSNCNVLQNIQLCVRCSLHAPLLGLSDTGSLAGSG